MKMKMINQFITDVHKRTCAECVFYVSPKWSNGYVSRCTKFGKKDVITGKIDFDMADLCRLNKNKCGENGRYFEQYRGIHQWIKNSGLVNIDGFINNFGILNNFGRAKIDGLVNRAKEYFPFTIAGSSIVVYCLIMGSLIYDKKQKDIKTSSTIEKLDK
jgi:hypothetical protein